MLERVFGNVSAKEYIVNAFRNNCIASSYIISGEEDTGQKVLAYELAYALLCENKENKPCDLCRSCKVARSGNHPDLIVLDSREKTSIGVDEIRERIADTVSIKPFASDRKVYIILEADKMTVQAQNSLLKTLEEPPSYAVFILATAHDRQLLSTIHSRCIRLETNIVSDESLREALNLYVGLREDESDLIASVAFGKIERAYFLAGHLDLLDLYSALPKLISVLESGLFDALKSHLDSMEDKGMSPAGILDLVKLWYRDLLLYLSTKDTEYIVFKRYIDEIKKGAVYYNIQTVLVILTAIDEANNRLRANVGKEPVLEILRETVQNSRVKPL